MAASAQALLSDPPKPCCPAGAEPCLITDYVPRGEMVQVRDLPVYVARPTGTLARAVVMLPDMHGVHTGRHKEFCDQLADAGFFVACPDFFVKSRYLWKSPASGTTACCVAQILCLWVTCSLSRTTRSHAWDVSLRRKVVDILLPWMKQQGAQQFAALGFCWGGYGAMKCGASPDFRCCAAFHPSLDQMCWSTGEDHLQICRDLRCPVLVVSTKQDTYLPGSEAEKACQEAVPGWVEFKFQEGMNHGYMVRAEVKDNPAAAEAVRRGFEDFVRLAKASMP